MQRPLASETNQPEVINEADEQEKTTEKENTEEPATKDNTKEPKADSKASGEEEETVSEETEKTVKEETLISGLCEKKTIRASKTMKDTVAVSPADGRILCLQMYDPDRKKWTEKKKIQLEKEGREKLTVTYPDAWKKCNVSKWRMVLEESDNALSFISGTVVITAVNRSELKLSAKSVLIMRADNKQILYVKSINRKRQIASTTKLMTAIVALEKKNLKKKFVISKKASKTPYGMGLEKGDILTFSQLLHAALIQSDNSSATAIAENTSGSVKKFVRQMNKKAKKLGCTNTNFTSPHGLPDKKNYSTAYDLALITRYAMKKKKLVKITRKKKVTFRTLAQKDRFKITTTNKLLGTKGLIAAKTGWTKAAGGCYAAEYRCRGKTYVIVVLASSNIFTRFSDAKKLIKYINRYG